jgi:hypothetical protein
MNLREIIPYAFRTHPQAHITEDYVSSPPAAVIVDERGDIFALGMNYYVGEWKGFEGVSRGEYCFDVLRNGIPTGEWAMRIERRSGRVRIFGPDGRKTWNGQSFI